MMSILIITPCSLTKINFSQLSEVLSRKKKKINHQNFTAKPLSSFSNSWFDCKCLKKGKACRRRRRSKQNQRYAKVILEHLYKTSEDMRGYELQTLTLIQIHSVIAVLLIKRAIFAENTC